MLDNLSNSFFNNVGRKIKAVTLISFISGALSSIILGLVWLTLGDEWALFGILTMFVGPFLFWISSFVLYGFGQLIENSDKSKEYLQHLAVKEGYKEIKTTQPSTTSGYSSRSNNMDDGFWICQSCKSRNSLRGDYCDQCGSIRKR